MPSEHAPEQDENRSQKLNAHNSFTEREKSNHNGYQWLQRLRENNCASIEGGISERLTTVPKTRAKDDAECAADTPLA